MKQRQWIREGRLERMVSDGCLTHFWKNKNPGKRSLKGYFSMWRTHNNSLKTKGNHSIVEMGCATGIYQQTD